MARARNIKPGFFSNERLADCDPLARIMFAGLWTIADRAGRLEDRPKRIKLDTVPYDDCDPDSLLGQLERNGFIVRYAIGEARYIQILAFAKHQNPHIREPESTIPAQCQHQTGTVHAEEKQEPARLIPDSLLLNPDSLYKPAASDDADCDPAFDQAWSEYPKRPGASRAGALKAWKARIKAKADPDEIIAGVKRYARYVEAMSVEPQFIKQPATFFGPDEHWKSDWTPQPRASPANRPAKFDPVAYVNQNRVTS